MVDFAVWNPKFVNNEFHYPKYLIQKVYNSPAYSDHLSLLLWNSDYRLHLSTNLLHVQLQTCIIELCYWFVFSFTLLLFLFFIILWISKLFCIFHSWNQLFPLESNSLKLIFLLMWYMLLMSVGIHSM